MPNVIDIDPLRAIAKRASDRIRDESVAKRFEKIALDRLLQDERNFRPATKGDLAKAPAWATEAVERGDQLSVYRSNSALAARVHMVARRLADACRVAATQETARPEYAAVILAARKFVAKFGRVNFDTAARKSLLFSRILVCWQENDDEKAVAEPQSLVLLGGRIWHRITSVAELRRVGREFRNCLARTTRTSAYGGQLAHGQAQFWVLRDLEGRGLMVAMASAPYATGFREVKGPNNATIRYDNSDLTQLGILIGVKPPPPEPPMPPSMIAAIEALQRPCRCSLCDPMFVRRLRRPGAAP